jgi:hypothetical protein
MLIISACWHAPVLPARSRRRLPASGFLIRGFGVRFFAGAPVLTWAIRIPGRLVETVSGPCSLPPHARCLTGHRALSHAPPRACAGSDVLQGQVRGFGPLDLMPRPWGNRRRRRGRA